MALSALNHMISEIRYATEPVQGEEQYHEDYVLIFVTRGSGEITVGDKKYPVEENDLIILSTAEPYTLRQTSEDFFRYFLSLREVLTDAHIRNPDLLNILKNHTDAFRHCISIAPIRKTAQTIFEKLLALDPHAPFANELAGCCVTELIIRVCRLDPAQFDSLLSGKERLLSVQNYLDTHYKEKISIDAVARKFYLSNCYLSHRFKELTGYSPKQYLTMIRLHAAADLICHSTLPLQDISAACGFSDANNFSKQFRREFSCSPSQMRTWSLQGLDVLL